jgi:hypothetical protein
LCLGWAACTGTGVNSERNAGASGAVTAPVAVAAPDEEARAAKAALGADAEVLLFGPLAGSGTRQAVAINRLSHAALPDAPQSGSGAPETGTQVSRVSILSKDDGAWHEVLRCDEYLKNSRGYLRGTPGMGVAGWRLEIERNMSHGTVLRFLPLAPPAAVSSGAVAVAWNPKAKRYQSLDRGGARFQGESSALEQAKSRLQ